MNTHRQPRSRALRLSFATACGVAIAVLLQCQSAAEVRAERQHALDAWNTVYQVLQHPRCKNCHPDGDVPLQGDASLPHAQGVQGGPFGEGLFAMRCDTCHQTTNTPGAHMPPGAPHWQLPPKRRMGAISTISPYEAAPPMVFEGRTSAELARQLADPKQNGNRTPEQLLHHMAEDELVGWGWNPGEGRTPVEVPRERLVAAMKTWIAAGCPVP